MACAVQTNLKDQKEKNPPGNFFITLAQACCNSEGFPSPKEHPKVNAQLIIAKNPSADQLLTRTAER